MSDGMSDSKGPDWFARGGISRSDKPDPAPAPQQGARDKLQRAAERRATNFGGIMSSAYFISELVEFALAETAVLRAEVARLRDALQEVVLGATTDADTCCVCESDVASHSAGCAIGVAEAAIAATPAPAPQVFGDEQVLAEQYGIGQALPEKEKL